jgi:hypothetical protein
MTLFYIAIGVFVVSYLYSMHQELRRLREDVRDLQNSARSTDNDNKDQE